QARHGTGQPEWRGNRARAPGPRHRRPSHHHGTARARALRERTRADHDVLRGRPRDRHDHPTGVDLASLAAPPPRLEPDEHLIAGACASFRGAAAASVRSTLALSAGRRRFDAYYAWQEPAAIAGLGTIGPEFVLGLTERELIVWSTSFWFSRPRAITG